MHVPGTAVRRAVALLVLGVLAFGSRSPHDLFAQAAQALSPEEAVLELLPYTMKQAELPAGYLPAGAEALVPAVEATNSSNPQSALARLTRGGFMVGFNQTLAAAATATIPEAELIVYLMADAASAHTYAI